MASGDDEGREEATSDAFKAAASWPSSVHLFAAKETMPGISRRL
jgi:hypothetical protein